MLQINIIIYQISYIVTTTMPERLTLSLPNHLSSTHIVFLLFIIVLIRQVVFYLIQKMGLFKKCCLVMTLIISVWGTLMLLIFGIFFKKRCVILLRSICELSESPNPEEYLKELYEYADTISLNCYVCAAVYAITAIVIGFYFYKLSSPEES